MAEARLANVRGGNSLGSAARLYGYDVFISFALGAPPRGSRSYASDLARRLRERDYTVFFSEEEAPAGGELDVALKRALQRSRVLVVIANRGTLVDPRWIKTEVQEFRRMHPGRPVIPINVGGALQEVSDSANVDAWLPWRDRIWVDDSERACEDGVVSDSTVARLITAPTAVRAATRWRITLALAFALLAALTVAALWFARSAEREATAARAAERQALSGRLAAESQLARESDSRLALLLARESWEMDRTNEAKRALFSALAEPVALPLATGLGRLQRVVRSADGRFIAATTASTEIHLWEITPNDRIQAFAVVASEAVNDIAFAPSGHTLAILDRTARLRLWDVDKRAWIREVQVAEGEEAWALAWRPDGRVIAVASTSVGRGQHYRFWDVVNWREASEPLKTDETYGVFRVAYSQNGERFAATVMDHIFVWDLMTRQLVVPPIATRAATRFVEFVSDDNIVFDGPGYEATSWVLWNNRAEQPTFGHANWVDAFAYAPAARLFATGSADHSIRLWHSSVHPWGRPLTFHAYGITSLAFARDGRELVSAGLEGDLVRWSLDPAAQRYLRSAGPTLADGTVDLTVSTDMQRVLLIGQGDSDRHALTWIAVLNDANSQPVRAHDATDGADEGLAVAADGTAVVRYGNDTAVFDRGGSRPRCVMGHSASQAWFSRSAEWVATIDDDQMLRVARARDCVELARRHRDEDDLYRGLAFAPSGSAIWLADAHGVRRWEFLRAGSKERVVSMKDPWIVVVDSREHLLGTTLKDGVIALFDLASNAPPQLLSGPHGQSTIRALAFSPDGNWLASAGDDEQVVLWDLAAGQAAGPAFAAGQGQLRRVAFSPDGNAVLTSGTDGPTVKVWTVDGDEWARRACDVARRNLTCAEWRRVMGPDRSYRLGCPALPGPPDAAACNNPQP